MNTAKKIRTGSALKIAIRQRAKDAPLSVRVLRSWMDGACSQAEVWNLFASQFGPKNGYRVTRALETLVGDLIACAQPSLERLPTGCTCVTSDELMLARLIDAAGRGERARAQAEAAGRLPVEAVDPILETATELGVYLSQLDECASFADHASAGWSRGSHTLH